MKNLACCVQDLVLATEVNEKLGSCHTSLIFFSSSRRILHHTWSLEDHCVPCGRRGGKGAGWEACAVSNSVTEEDGGLDHSGERGMQSRENCRNLGMEETEVW